MAKVTKKRQMSVSMQALRRAITDYERYPDFLPEVETAKVLTRSDAGADVQFEIYVIKKFQYTLRFDTSRPDRVSWTLLSSDFFKKNQGSWDLTAAGDKSTDVSYELEVDFGGFVPGFITKTLTETNLPALLDKFEAHARDIDG